MNKQIKHMFLNFIIIVDSLPYSINNPKLFYSKGFSLFFYFFLNPTFWFEFYVPQMWYYAMHMDNQSIFITYNHSPFYNRKVKEYESHTD